MSSPEFPDKPYIVTNMEPIQQGDNDGVSSETIKAKLEAGSREEIARREIQSYVDQYIPEFAQPYIEQYLDNNIGKLKEQGKVELVGPGHELYGSVERAVDAYNKAHPDTSVSMPRHIALGNNIPTAYDAGLDVLQINEKENTLPDNEKEAIIAHELGHKAQYGTGMIKQAQYNVAGHVAAVSPDVYGICQKDGFTVGEIETALPSDEFADVIPKMEMPEQYQQIFLRLDDGLEYLENPTERVALNWKLAFNPDCAREVTRVHDTMSSALLITSLENKRLNRETELDADKRAAEVYGNINIAKALADTHKAHDIGSSQEDEIMHTHPALKTRVENLGCTLNEGDEPSCPVTPVLPGKGSIERK